MNDIDFAAALDRWITREPDDADDSDTTGPYDDADDRDAADVLDLDDDRGCL